MTDVQHSFVKLIVNKKNLPYVMRIDLRLNFILLLDEVTHSSGQI